MAVAVDPSGDVHLDEEAEEIYEQVEEGTTYGELADEYGEKFAFIAAQGPDAVIQEEEETIYLGEISISGAHDMSTQYEENLTPSKKNAVTAAGGATATLGTALQFLRTGEPGWLASSLVSANLTKNPVKRLYNEVEAYREFQEDIQAGIDDFKDAFEGVREYDVEINEEDIAGQLVGSMNPTEALGEDLPSLDELDTGQGFQ